MLPRGICDGSRSCRQRFSGELDRALAQQVGLALNITEYETAAGQKRLSEQATG
jgi:hypothetical protein